LFLTRLLSIESICPNKGILRREKAKLGYIVYSVFELFTYLEVSNAVAFESDLTI